MSSYEYHQLLKFLYFEGYADSYADAEELLESMSDEEFDEIIEAKNDSYLEPNMKKREENNKKAIKDMMNTDAYNQMVKTVRKQFDEARNVSPEVRQRAQNIANIRRKRKKLANMIVQSDVGPNHPVVKQAERRGVRPEHLPSYLRKENFNIVKEYLVAEGYADTNEAALAIMANMSEEWKQNIIEAKYEEGKSKEEKQKIRTQRSGFTGPYANNERRGAHQETDERNKDLADLRKGKKKNSSYFSYLP